MRITQGTFSFLPDLSDEEIGLQIAYAMKQGWAVAIEHTDDPHPRNAYWEMYGLPMFDITDPAEAMAQLDECRKVFPRDYIKINAFDSSLGFETVRLSFIVQRPAEEKGFELRRIEAEGRTQCYSIRAYSADRPAGERY